MVSETSTSHVVTSASHYQSRSSIYIRGLIPRNWPRQFRMTSSEHALFDYGFELKIPNKMSYLHDVIYDFGWNKIKYARTDFMHVYFIVLRLAGSRLGRCLKTRPDSCLKSSLGTLQMVISWQNQFSTA